MLLTRHTVYLGVLEEGDEVPRHATYCDIMHITRIETLTDGPPPETAT